MPSTRFLRQEKAGVRRQCECEIGSYVCPEAASQNASPHLSKMLLTWLLNLSTCSYAVLAKGTEVLSILKIR